MLEIAGPRLNGTARPRLTMQEGIDRCRIVTARGYFHCCNVHLRLLRQQRIDESRLDHVRPVESTLDTLRSFLISPRSAANWKAAPGMPLPRDGSLRKYFYPALFLSTFIFIFGIYQRALLRRMSLKLPCLVKNYQQISFLPLIWTRLRYQ